MIPVAPEKKPDEHAQKLQCLARWMFSQYPELWARRAALARIERHRGKLAADMLKAEMLRQWNEGRR